MSEEPTSSNMETTAPTPTETSTITQTADAQAGTMSVGATTPISEQAAQLPPENTQVLENFRSMLPEELRNEPSLSNYKDVAGMAKSLVAAQKELGSRIRIPGPDASNEIKQEFLKKLETIPGVVALPDGKDPAAMNAFLTKLGRPESPDQYDVNVDPEMMQFVPGLKDKIPEFKVLAHQLGLNKQQASALVEFETANTTKVIDKMLADKESTTALLKEQWGGDFKNRFEAAKDVFGHFRTKYPEAVQSLLNGVEGNNPVVLMMAAELGKTYKESGIITGTREVNYGLTPEEATNRIRELKANPDFQKDYNSDDDKVRYAAIDKLSALYEAQSPTKTNRNP